MRKYKCRDCQCTKWRGHNSNGSSKEKLTDGLPAELLKTDGCKDFRFIAGKSAIDQIFTLYIAEALVLSQNSKSALGVFERKIMRKLFGPVRVGEKYRIYEGWNMQPIRCYRGCSVHLKATNVFGEKRGSHRWNSSSQQVLYGKVERN